MKIFLICFFILVNQDPQPFSEYSNDELFRKGNSFYKEEHYTNAIECYRKIIENGVTNGYLYYNLGNAYFREGSLGYAILYYERAHILLPRDKEINENLSFVKNFRRDKIEKGKPSFLIFILYNLLKKISLEETSIIVSIIFSITLICSILFILKKNLLFLKNLTISMLCILMVFSFLLSLKIKMVNRKIGVALIDKVDVKSAPSHDATLEFVIHEGTEFQILEPVKEWTKIRMDDGKTGWIQSNTSGKI